MKRFRRGFTLIEVALFLAVTGALFVGIAIGVQNSIFQQRFNDSVQNYAEFLRSVYAGVMNVQEKNPGGRGERAVYGKLITFGEKYDFNGCPVNGGDDGNINRVGCENDKDKNTIFVYDVVGDIGEVDTGNIVDSLKNLNADVVTVTEGEDGESVNVERNGLVDSYTPRWAARIEKVGCEEEESCLFTGSLLIVRHPRSGAVYTLVSNEIVDVNKPITSNTITKGNSDILKDMLDSFGLGRVDFCINPNDTSGGLRTDVRVIKNARNASGVEIIADESNPCMATD